MNIRCITNRHLTAQDYFAQIEQLALAGPEAIIVREKDLPQDEYKQLAAGVMEICAHHHVLCILHTYTEAAIQLGAKALHLPLPLLLSMKQQQKSRFAILGASIHSVEQAQLAQNAGASYLTAGHVFETACKPGVEPRGLDFLREVCQASALPVYAIGGIHPKNATACIQAGAYGICIMSDCMRHTDTKNRLKQYQIQKDRQE